MNDCRIPMSMSSNDKCRSHRADKTSSGQCFLTFKKAYLNRWAKRRLNNRQRNKPIYLI